MILQLLIISGVACLLYSVGEAVYNLFFHELAGFKGPRTWAAFRFPFVYRLNTGRLPQTVHGLHQRYGPIVRVAPNELSFVDPAAWSDIHSRGPGKRSFRRPKEWRGDFPISQSENLITADEKDHARMRKFLKPAFDESALKRYDPTMHHHVDLLVKHMRARAESRDGDDEMEIVRWYNYTTFDIIGALTFGESFECLTTGKIHPWLGVSMQFQTALLDASIKHYPLLDAVLKHLTPKSALKPLYDLLRMTRDKLVRRLRRKDGDPDFMTYIMQNAEDTGNLLNDHELDLNVVLIAVAGSDTISAALSGATNHLIKHPETYKRLVDELRAAFTSEDQITSTALVKLPYLNAVLNETLRLCPPSAEAARRSVPEGGSTVAGTFIPGNTTVSIMPYAASRSADNFVDPEEWHPERWLPEGKNEGDDLTTVQPFLLGARTCLGQKFAWIEMRLVLARVLWNFDLAATHRGILEWTSQRIFMNWMKEPMFVKVRNAR